MNGYVGWMFDYVWESTKLTYRIFRWLFRWVMIGISWVLNRRQNQVAPGQPNLFDPETK